MYAVIFKAKMNTLDDRYFKMASKLRDLAIENYGCTEFTSVAEGSEEITISYWKDLAQIKNWKNDAQHKVAQTIGQAEWYQSYTVQVVEILREYGSEASS